MENKKIGWKFEKSESGDADGLNDGGVESFRDDHLLSLAKESAQNSLDNQSDKNIPVILEFKTFYIEQKDFPDVDNYKEIIDLQIDYWKNAKKDKSSEDFFKEAKNTLNSKKVFCLRISDFNTTGLDGSLEGKNTPFSRWFKLVRSRGVTDNDPLAGGSFGLGKFASFACSKIRTVFYSTRDLRGVESHQGVSILASYDTKQGERTRGKGYFCKLDDFSCIEGQINLNKSFKRDSPGTDIYIMGFIDNEQELEDKLFSSILRSFLLAIYKGNLIFHFDGKTIEKNNLRNIIDKYRDDIYRNLISKETIEYYDILEGKMDPKEYNFTIFEKDDVKLKIAIGAGLSKKVGMFRNNGMKIFDKKGIRSYNDFVGMVLLEGDKVNAYFRKLENPEHDNWRHERSDDPKKAKETIQKMFNFITKSLKDLEDKTMPESENIEGINSLQDEEFEEEGIKPLEGLDFKPLKVRESKTNRKIKNKIKIRLGDIGESKPEPEPEENSESDTNPEPEPEPEPNPEPGPGGNNNKNFIIEVFPKTIKIFRDKNEEYNLIFSLPEKSDNITCKIFIGGEEFNEKVSIEKAGIIKQNQEVNTEFKDNEIKLGLIEKDISNHIKFKLKEDEKWALEVNFYEN